MSSIRQSRGQALARIDKDIASQGDQIDGLRLEAKELVERKRDQPDRRKVRICATEEGRLAAAKAPSLLQANLTANLRLLPELEREAIALSLEHVVELMEAEHLDASPLLAQEPTFPSKEEE